MLSVLMPKSSTSFLFVDTATKCFDTAASPRVSVSQRRAAVALVNVSRVENVFDATMKSVVAGVGPSSFAPPAAGAGVGEERAPGAPPAEWGGGVLNHTRPRAQPPHAPLSTG